MGITRHLLPTVYLLVIYYPLEKQTIHRIMLLQYKKDNEQPNGTPGIESQAECR